MIQFVFIETKKWSYTAPRNQLQKARYLDFNLLSLFMLLGCVFLYVAKFRYLFTSVTEAKYIICVLLICRKMFLIL